ncbi:hypothetical protein StrepF001_11850 [Streptomyces sp. F001]|nr:hypothetical protein StrepF001_11850 [Streptomyces sp. F001]
MYLEAAVEGAVPCAADVASDALSSSLHIGEAAGLLAETLQGSRLILVCDNVERIAPDETCIAVLSFFARYLPPGVNLVLISRVDVSLDTGSTSERDRVGELVESDLSFDAQEAAAALRTVGRVDVSPVQAVAATGAGSRASCSRAGAIQALTRWIPICCGPMSQRTSSTLSPTERTFLLHTSLLEEVSVGGARALGQENAAQVMADLRARHLPVTWSSDGSRMAPHPVFRDFLLEALGREDAKTISAVRRRHAELLIARGEHEEAIDELLLLGDLEAAGGWLP